MADSKISDLPSVTTPTTADLFAVVQSGTTSQMTRGNLAKKVVEATAKTANYTLLVSDEYIPVDSTSGNITISVPTAIGNTGKTWIIKKTVAANHVDIDPDGSETIDGAAFRRLINKDSMVAIMSDGTNIVIVGEKN